MRKPYLGTAATCAIGAALGGAQAHAQAGEDSYFIRDRNVSVVDRVQAYNRAEGIRTGSFVVRPQLEVGAGWTSNVFALSDSGLPGLEFVEDESALFGFVRPSVAGVSDWNRHEVRFDGYVEGTGNERFDSETFVTAGASVGGFMEIDRSSELFGAVSFDHLREGREVNNTFLVSEEPVQYDLAQAEIGLRREFGRTRGSVRFDLSDYDYDDVVVVPIALFQTDEDGERVLGPDGAVLPVLNADGTQAFLAQGDGDQDFRDHTAYRATAEAAYALSPDTALVVRGQLEQRDYDGRDQFGLDRDSEGFRVAAGVEFDLTRLVRGEVTLGYFERDFEDPQFEDASGLGVDVGVEWFPTELTTVTLTGSRDVEDSPFVNAGGVVREEAVVQIDHELRRDVSLYAYGGLGQDRFDDLDRNFDRVRAGVGARYYLNDHLALGASYDYIEQEIDLNDETDALGAFGAPYDTHRALVTVTVTP